MRLTRVRLRNYRVYEDLDLELPPGLIGVYGSNGSGKSTLCEAIRFALWGKARTENCFCAIGRPYPVRTPLVAPDKTPRVLTYELASRTQFSARSGIVLQVGRHSVDAEDEDVGPTA